MRRPTAIVFDLDGTLVDSRRDIADACNQTLSDHGREVLPLERILPMVGDGARALVARAFSLSEDDARVDAPLATFQARYLARPCVHTTLLPGAREALALGPTAALVTNKPRAITTALLSALGLDGALRAVRGGGDGALKPAPDMILSALAELDVPPSDAWVIGDGAQDVLAGKAAGCATVYVPGIGARERALAAGPDLVITSLCDLEGAVTAARS